MLDERHVFEQLACICRRYPLFAGDTISHGLAKECADRGWAVRNTAGDWIPTAAGILANERALERLLEQGEPREDNQS